MIDIREEIDNAPIGAYHRLLLLLVGLAVFFDGDDTFNASYVIHYVMKPWGMLPGQAGFMVSSGLIGFSTAALLQGKFSDRYGRRPVMLFGLWVMTIFSFCTAIFAHSFATFCLFRFLTGLGLGILLPLGVTYVNEFAPRRVKSTFSSWGWGLGFSLGGATAAVVGVYLTPSLGWEALYFVASLSVFLAITCQAILPESIQFLAMRGSNLKAVSRLLSRLNPAGADVYRQPGARFVFPEDSSRTTLACWGAAFFVLFGVYGLTGWVFGYGALILMMNFVGTLAYSDFADRRGQGRAALVVWWIAGAIAAGILAVVNIHFLGFDLSFLKSPAIQQRPA